MFCPDPKAMDDLKPVSLPFDGCQYKNLTYKQVIIFLGGQSVVNWLFLTI